jgi:uncharacterized membrane protein YhaH (DUF805 family)
MGGFSGGQAMRGDILHFEAGAGVIAGEDGNRYAFEAADFRRDAPRAGLTVDFVADGGTAREIYPLGVAAVPQAIVPQLARPVAVERERGVFGYFFRALTDKYADFGGRARRKEYWGFALVYALLLVVVSGVIVAGAVITSNSAAGAADGAPVYVSPMLYLGGFLAFLLVVVFVCPSLAVTVRRLHDIGQSGWLVLVQFIPGVGSLILLIMLCIDGEKQPNAYGPPVK